MKFRKNAKGTLESNFYHIIPYLVYFSASRVTNGKNVDMCEKYKTSGRVYALHITPFIHIALNVKL